MMPPPGPPSAVRPLQAARSRSRRRGPVAPRRERRCQGDEHRCGGRGYLRIEVELPGVAEDPCELGALGVVGDDEHRCGGRGYLRIEVELPGVAEDPCERGALGVVLATTTAAVRSAVLNENIE